MGGSIFNSSIRDMAAIAPSDAALSACVHIAQHLHISGAVVAEEFSLALAARYPRTRPRGTGTSEPEDHIIIVGLNSLGRELAVRLHEKGEQIVAIDIDPHKSLPVPGIGNDSIHVKFSRLRLKIAVASARAPGVCEISNITAVLSDPVRRPS